MKESRWPKRPIPLTDEQLRLKQEFLKVWHEILPQKYSLIEKFNQECDILKSGVKPGIRTLEIGAGLGEHLNHEDFKVQDYTALEVRPDFVEIIKKKFPGVKALAADIESRTILPEHSFDRVIAIHVLEHLRNLPAALEEVRRVLKPSGNFSIVIPCEGGVAYALARKISAKRVFEKLYKRSYTPIIKNEHVNEAWEIIEELKKKFTIQGQSFWPLKIPLIPLNLVIALRCTPRNDQSVTS
jgi:ubiquinone/menaquinone biosynthesis C-methylase UbiE